MRKGFSLVEMAIVLVIMSVIAGGVIKLLPKTAENKLQEINAAKMNAIQDAIVAYVNENNMIPCPADITTAVNTSTFGTAGTNCNATISGDITVGSFSLRIGMVPVRALNLPDDYAFDSWGNRIRYAAIKELAVSSTNFSNFATNYTGLSPNTRTFEIRDGSGNAINSANSYSAPTANNSVAYVLLSHGANGNGAVPFAGGAAPSCPGSGLLDQENCNGDKIFRDTFFSTANSNYFDDYIRWKTYNQLRVDANLIGSAASNSTADTATLEYVANCTGACAANTGMSGTLASNSWIQRAYNSVSKNFTNNPLVQTCPTCGSFTLTPGTYTFIGNNYYNSTIATNISCRVSNLTSGASVGLTSETIPANTNGNISVLSTYTITTNSTFWVECMFTTYTSGQTIYYKPSSFAAIFALLIIRH